MNAHEPATKAFAVGYAFLAPDDQLLDAAALIRYFAPLSSSSDLKQMATLLNGSWSYCSYQDAPQGKDVFAIVDHRSSCSLYYRVEEGKIRIRENGFDLLHDDESPIETPQNLILFFSQWGFTPENRTLHPKIHRIPAGCGIYFKAQTGEVETLRYDSCLYEEKPLEGIDYIEAKALFSEAWHIAVQRMVRLIADRPVILPLTAGRDSRLIALALKAAGITPITCTYGRTESIHEVQRAQVIAEKLGFPHRFFSTIPEGYNSKGYTEDEAALDYLRYVSGLGSGYFFGEYTTAQTLAREYPSAIVLPGHNGDILGGDNLHQRFFDGEHGRAMNAYLLCFHERGNRILNRLEVSQLTDLHEKIFTSYPTHLSGKELFEMFRNRELMPKYYINSSRSWRYFRLDVWMPFLDQELCQLMHRLPQDYRIGKRLYEEVTQSLFQEAGIAFSDDISLYAQWQKPAFRVKQLIRPFVIYHRARRAHSPFTREDPMGFRTLMEGELRHSVRQNIPWKTTTINGLSFAWWLWYNRCLSH